MGGGGAQPEQRGRTGGWEREHANNGNGQLLGVAGTEGDKCGRYGVKRVFFTWENDNMLDTKGRTLQERGNNRWHWRRDRTLAGTVSLNRQRGGDPKVEDAGTGK